MRKDITRIRGIISDKTASESEILKPDGLLNLQKIFHWIPHSRFPQIQHFLFVDQKNRIFGFRIRDSEDLTFF
jgi:zona occludens toxin (predicted ATPase)